MDRWGGMDLFPSFAGIYIVLGCNGTPGERKCREIVCRVIVDNLIHLVWPRSPYFYIYLWFISGPCSPENTKGSMSTDTNVSDSLFLLLLFMSSWDYTFRYGRPSPLEWNNAPCSASIVTVAAAERSFRRMPLLYFVGKIETIIYKNFFFSPFTFV